MVKKKKTMRFRSGGRRRKKPRIKVVSIGGLVRQQMSKESISNDLLGNPITHEKHPNERFKIVSMGDLIRQQMLNSPNTHDLFGNPIKQEKQPIETQDEHRDILSEDNVKNFQIVNSKTFNIPENENFPRISEEESYEKYESVDDSQVRKNAKINGFRAFYQPRKRLQAINRYQSPSTFNHQAKRNQYKG